jgi:hypothetical protein
MKEFFSGLWSKARIPAFLRRKQPVVADDSDPNQTVRLTPEGDASEAEAVGALQKPALWARLRAAFRRAPPVDMPEADAESAQEAASPTNDQPVTDEVAPVTETAPVDEGQENKLQPVAEAEDADSPSGSEQAEEAQPSKGFWSRLMGRFRRKPVAEAEDVQEDVPEDKEEPTPAAEEAEPSSETELSEEVQPSKGFWSRLMGRFRRKPEAEVEDVQEAVPEGKAKSKSDKGEADSPAGTEQADATQKNKRQPVAEATPEAAPEGKAKSRTARGEVDSPAGTEQEGAAPPSKGFWSRLMGRFRRKPAPGTEAAEQTESEGNTPSEPAAEGEGTPPSLGSRIRSRLLTKWGVLILLVLLLVLGVGGGVLFFLTKAPEEKHVKGKVVVPVVSAESQRLAEENRKLQLEKKQLELEKKKLEEKLDNSSRSSGGRGSGGSSGPGTESPDCTVTSKEDVAANLKGCIEALNTGGGR